MNPGSPHGWASVSIPTPWSSIRKATTTAAILAILPLACPAQEVLERLSERLNFAVADGQLQVRFSGSLELEGYAISDPVADLVSGDKDVFLRPRFNLFLDAQWGKRGYVFAQGRVDRGFDVFDPESDFEARLDEYAVRLELSEPGSGGLVLQAGKFASVVGNWTKRHSAWENPFVTAPLPYDNLTPIWDVNSAPNADTLLAWGHVSPVGNAPAVLADKEFRLPIIWGPSYAQGVALAGKRGRLEYAAEVKAVGVSARPQRWDEGFSGTERPALGARVGWRPNASWNLGFSASRGEYLDRAEHTRIPAGFDRHDYRQVVLAHDLSYAWHYWQIWGEVYAARYTIPRVANLETLAWYVEAKYRFTPQFSGAVRWGQQWFDDIADRTGRSLAAGRQTWRLEVAPSYRLTTQVQLKLQYGLRHDQPADGRCTQSLAAQLTVRF